jgi:hypothetical protein
MALMGTHTTLWQRIGARIYDPFLWFGERLGMARHRRVLRQSVRAFALDRARAGGGAGSARGAVARRAAAMDQQIRFCSTPTGRIAYAEAGVGPALVLPAWWVSHLELDWESADFRVFMEALAARRRVIRYDPLGTGVSDRRRDGGHGGLDGELEHWRLRWTGSRASPQEWSHRPSSSRTRTPDASSALPRRSPASASST